MKLAVLAIAFFGFGCDAIWIAARRTSRDSLADKPEWWFSRATVARSTWV